MLGGYLKWCPLPPNHYPRGKLSTGPLYSGFILWLYISVYPIKLLRIASVWRHKLAGDVGQESNPKVFGQLSPLLALTGIYLSSRGLKQMDACLKWLPVHKTKTNGIEMY